MATSFSKINVKAAAVTGAVLGFLCWLLIIPFGFMGYGGMMTGFWGIFHGYTIASVAIDVVLSAALGGLIAVIYNWALSLK